MFDDACAVCCGRSLDGVVVTESASEGELQAFNQYYIQNASRREVLDWLMKLPRGRGWCASVCVDFLDAPLEVSFSDPRLETLFLLQWGNSIRRVEKAWMF